VVVDGGREEEPFLAKRDSSSPASRFEFLASGTTSVLQRHASPQRIDVPDAAPFSPSAARPDVNFTCISSR
jgi:hypothetical protein